MRNKTKESGKFLLIAASENGIEVKRFQSKEDAHKEMKAYIHNTPKSDYRIEDMSGWIRGKYDMEFRIYEI